MYPSEALEILKSLPGSWHPRRDQPSWDRDFSGKAEISQHFAQGSDKAVSWLSEAVAFSKIVKDGYNTAVEPDGLSLAGKRAKSIVAEFQRKNGK